MIALVMLCCQRFYRQNQMPVQVSLSMAKAELGCFDLFWLVKGKLLITRYSDNNPATKEPVMYYSKLPKRIKDGPVILLDPILLSGETMKGRCLGFNLSRKLTR